jgi:ankyrin repeat protein
MKSMKMVRSIIGRNTRARAVLFLSAAICMSMVWLWCRAHADAGLLSAVRSGDVPSTRFYLAMGADPNVKDAAGKTALLLAADAPEVRGPFVMQLVNGHSVCRQQVARRGYAGTVAALIRAGARTDVRGSDGKSPLDQASALEEREVVDLIKSVSATSRHSGK